jgi:branched-chain amino acid transport system permease protein
VAAGFIALGLVQGALAGLNAVGLVLLWRTTRVLNLAQPALGLVGGVLTGLLVSAAGWSFWWAAPIGVVTGAAIGLAAERGVLVRLQNVPRVVLLVATVGLAQLLAGIQTALPFAFGGRLPSYDVDLGIEIFVFPVLLKGAHLLALAALPVAVGLVWWFTRSRIGVAALAAGQDSERAVTLGVPIRFVRAMAWSIAGALSGVAGVLAIPVLGFSLGDGIAPTVLLLAVAPAVLAGLRSIGGAALAALALGVGYQAALTLAPRAGLADLVLATAIVIAVAMQRRRLVRVQVSERASSWEAAASSRPLPRAIRDHRRWRSLTRAGVIALLLAAALPPLWLSPSADVRYGTGAALCLAAVAVAVAWTFAGTIALGHWGLAAIGAAIAALTPGPLLVRAGAATVVVALAGFLLGLVDRRPGGMVGPVAGLALAVAAPVGMLALGQVSLGGAAQPVAQIAGVATAIAAVAAVWLRGHVVGARLVAARDEPRRARWLGIDATRSRHAVMAGSAGLAGLAGALYLAAVPAGLAPGAFAADRSLELLALTVVGGLGAPLGAAIGAAGLILAATVLPAPWGILSTGIGVLVVVLFVPAGLGRALEVLRDALARAITGAAATPAADPPPADTPTSGAAQPATAEDRNNVDIVAGSDTAAALTTPTVRAAMVCAVAVAGPALAAAVGFPAALRDHLGADAGAAAPWVVFAILGAAVAAAVVAARRPVDLGSGAVPAEVAGLAAAAVSAGLVAWLADAVLATLAFPLLTIATGWVIGRLVRLATAAVPAISRAAAAGLVTVAALTGVLGAVQLGAAATPTVLGSLLWVVGYLVAGALAFGRAATVVRADAITAASRNANAPLGRLRAGTLRAQQVSVSYGTDVVLHDVTFDVRPGELLALIGGNGTGKSTLLRAVAGLVPAQGQLRLAGRDLSVLRPEHRAVAGVALVSGARPVFPDLTVRDNLRVGGYLTHRSHAAFTAATQHVLAVAPSLAQRMDTRAGVLSGGEQRLLALAQSLYRRPAILLADELTLGLDRDAQETTLRLLRLFADEGVGVVVVDHDLEGLLPRSDRAIVLADGHAVVVDDPAALDQRRRRETMQATFLSAGRS